MVICPLGAMTNKDSASANYPCMLNSCGMYDDVNQQCAFKTIAQKDVKPAAKTAPKTK